jgi:hypothetical protein
VRHERLRRQQQAKIKRTFGCDSSADAGAAIAQLREAKWASQVSEAEGEPRERAGRSCSHSWLARSSVAGRIGVIAAGGVIVGTCCRRPPPRGRTDRSRTVGVWSPAIPGAVSDVGMIPNADVAGTDSPSTGVAASEAAEAKVDEECRRPVAAGQFAFEHVDIEGQPVAIELRRLEHHDGVADFRSVLAEHRDGGVRRILGKALFAVVARRPFFQQVGREGMTRRASGIRPDVLRTGFSSDRPGCAMRSGSLRLSLRIALQRG